MQIESMCIDIFKVKITVQLSSIFLVQTVFQRSNAIFLDFVDQAVIVTINPVRNTGAKHN